MSFTSEYLTNETICIFLIFLQIIHLKRFNCVNNKWVKSQKVVHFPFDNFDPTPYLAAVPQETILRHKELLEMNEISHTLNGINDESGATVANDMEETSKNLRQENVLSKNTNTTTATATATVTTTPSPNNGNITTTTVANKTLNGLTTEAQLSLNEKVNNLLNLQQQQHPHNNHPTTQQTQTKNILDNCRNIVDNFNNEDKNSSSSPRRSSIENCDDDDDEQDEESSDKMLDNAAIIRRTDVDDRTLTRRKRLISTSLTKTPIVDGAFEDFHQHKLKNAEDPFDPKYKLYAVVVSRIYNIFQKHINRIFLDQTVTFCSQFKHYRNYSYVEAQWL